MRQGDYVLVQSGMIHAVGRVNCGAAVFLGMPQPGFVNLDVNVLSTHLPQGYRVRECKPLEVVKLGEHGFCELCRGWGLTSMYDHAASITEVLDGKAGDLCPDCGGSGRQGVKVSVERSDGGAAVRTDIQTDSQSAVTCEICAAAYVPYEGEL